MLEFGRGLRIDLMSWEEVKSRIDSGMRTVVVAVGSTEQHGPHLPIATDEILGTAMAGRVAELLGDALVAPTIRPGFSPHHMDFAGTITLRHSTLAEVIRDYVSCLGRHGFERIVVICAHGGNSPTIRLACQEIQAERPPFLVIPVYDLMQYACISQNYFGRQEGLHANLIETSWMLFLAPELVHMEKACADGDMRQLPVRDLGVPLFHGATRDLSRSGVLGDPLRASAELGRRSFEELTNAVAEEVRALSAWFGQHRKA